MNKHYHFLELVKLILDDGKITLENRLEILDCFLSFPAQCIPDSNSLFYFAYDATLYFLGVNDYCKESYPEAARYITAWREEWLPPSAQEVSLPNPKTLLRRPSPCERN